MPNQMVKGTLRNIQHYLCIAIVWYRMPSEFRKGRGRGLRSSGGGTIGLSVKNGGGGMSGHRPSVSLKAGGSGLSRQPVCLLFFLRSTLRVVASHSHLIVRCTSLFK